MRTYRSCSANSLANRMRDDFTEETRRTLAARAGSRCSNPDCGALTSGPQLDSTKALNVGVAAHITAASPGGARFDVALRPEERRSADNAIWLCQTCAKLVDNDATRFDADTLRAWKRTAEENALHRIGKTSPSEDDSETGRKVREIAPWIGKPVTLAQMNTGKAVILLGPVRGRAQVTLVDCNESYATVRVGETSRSIPLSFLEVSFDHTAGRLELQERCG
jgi:hypothetical protein